MKKTALALATVASLAACSAHDHDHGSPNLTVTISGEGAALTGFAFPSASSNDLAFVDGWDVKFERILVTVDDIRLSDNPDTNPTDQAQTGAVVATAKGPWAVDMSKPGAVTDIKPRAQLVPLADDHDHDHDGHSHGATGKDPLAQPLARFDALDGNKSFDPALRYAFGFDVVVASPAAELTNLDEAARADYADMVSKGISVLYVGTATFKGVDCASSDPSYDFSKLPTTVKFRFGFKSPTTYKNCQNSDLRGKAFDGEEAQRGVQVSEQGGTVAQITLHVDHPFWSTVDHDAAELFFDQMAAVASPDGTLVTEDLEKLDFTSFKDAEGAPLPWRSCIAAKPVKTGVRRFDAGSVAVHPSASPESALRHYADYVTYQQSTQGHLNAAGLCAVERNFAAPR
ncbi:MAG: hypothetical protein KIS78_30570 [Labilithrix sp.]|nr:hypothetical protein [Labilithrix sp.]MCW5836780.1 hypothetical protein [Labilithrix sp.]